MGAAIWRYRGKVPKFQVLKEEIAEEWVRATKVCGRRLLWRVEWQIRTPEDAWDKVLGAACERWEDFVNPDWPGASSALAKMRSRMRAASDTWLSDLEEGVGADGERYRERVESAKERYRKFAHGVWLAGDEDKMGLGPAWKATMLFTGSPVPLSYLTEDDEMENPQNLCSPIKPLFRKPARGLLLSRLCGYGSLILVVLIAHEMGIFPDISDAELLKEKGNAEIQDLLSKLVWRRNGRIVCDGREASSCFIGFELDGADLYIAAEVS